MITIQQTIAEKFLKQLEGSGRYDAAVIERLRAILQSGKVKADEIVQIFASPTDTGIK